MSQATIHPQGIRRNLMQQSPRHVVFITVLETGSLTAAAEQLGIGKSMVSRHLNQLEAQLGTRLLQRSTRTVRPTRAGEVFARHAEQAIVHAEMALRSLDNLPDQPLTGNLRVTVAELACKRLAPLIAQFTQQYPGVDLELVVDDSRADLHAEGYDLGVRYGWVKSGDMVHYPLTREVQCLVATAAYLRRFPTVRSPKDLAPLHWVTPHPKIVDFAKWPAVDGEGNTHYLPIESRSVSNSAHYVLDLVMAGVGISIYPLRNVAQLLNDGQLQQLLPELQLPTPGMYLNYPSQTTLPPAATQFIRLAKQHFGVTESIT